MAYLQKLPAQLALCQGNDGGKLHVNKAATSLSNFPISCKEEIALACQAMGKMSFRELSRADLVTTAQFMGVRYAASRRQKPVGTWVYQTVVPRRSGRHLERPAETGVRGLTRLSGRVMCHWVLGRARACMTSASARGAGYSRRIVRVKR